MDNQQIPKADSKFQKIARKNHRKWKLRLLSKGGQKADSGGGPYNKKPDYNRAKSAPPGFGGSLEEIEQLDEVIRKKNGKYCLFSKKTKRNLGCYPTRAGAMKRERQVQYFKHLKEEIVNTLIELLEEGKKNKGKEDRCVRIAKSKYDAWPSAYASGAVVKCRQGKIWKDIKEEEELEEDKKLKHKLKKSLASALSTMTAVLPPPDSMKSPKKEKPSIVIKRDQEELEEEWSQSERSKRKSKCSNPKGFTMRQFCKNQRTRSKTGQKTNESSDPKEGTGKKPKGSGRRLYTDENPKDTVSVKFSTAEDIRDTLSKESFKSKSHARQSQIINLIHQRVRAAHENAKDPETKARLRIALDYAEKRKEASKKKTASLQKEEVLTEKCWPGYTQKGMKTMFGKKYPNCVKKTNEETELEERKLGKPSSETSLRDWFKRKGAPGKRGGWVDCNTCRNGKCSPCGRQGGEQRSKYPRCRPTPAQCKGYKRRGDNLQKEEE